jgi:cytidine deaminase
VSRLPEAPELQLFEEARGVAERAYAPYSGYAVGAVAVGPSGRGHHGVNVENAASPAGLCAERAVAALDGSDCLPCGMCLQALAEFGNPEIVARAGGDVRVVRLRDLLTAPFALPEPGADG